MKKLGGLLLVSALVIPSCGFLSQNSPEQNGIMGENTIEQNLLKSYADLMNAKCRFHTIGDWIAYGYSIAPSYSYKQKFAKLFNLPLNCRLQPINNIDLGIIRGDIADKEQSCLGFTNLKAPNRLELAKRIYRFVNKEVQEKCF